MQGRIQAKNLLHAASAVAASAPCFYLAWTLVQVWRDPLSIDQGSWVRFGVGLMVLEFVLLHSGAFIAAMVATRQHLKGKLKLLGILLLFYSLMVWGFAVSFESAALVWIFVAVTAGRVAAAITAGADGKLAAGAMAARSAIGLLLYLFTVFASVFLPIPEWGITPSIVADVYPDRGNGVWEVEPQRAIAAAAVYFLLLGMAELFILGPVRTDAKSRLPLDESGDAQDHG